MGEEPRRFTKRGYVMESPEGELLLVNESGVAYRVNESVIAVWNSFEDKTVDEVVEELSQQLQVSPSEISDAVKRLATQLVDAELLG